MNNLKIIFSCVVFSILFYTSAVFADHASASFEIGAAGAIMTMPGATLPKGDVVFGVNAQFIDMDEISDSKLEALGALDEDVHSVGSLLNMTANIAYGFTDDLTMGVSLPYVDRNDIREAHNDGGMGEAELAGDSTGIGDLSLFGQYRFFHDDNQDAALIAGLKMPTGETDEKEREGGLFETEQQPGSGSWDPFVGLAFNRSWGKTGVSANVLYTFATEGSQQTELGNIFNYNLALSYRAYSPEGTHNHHQHKHALNVLDYVDMALELNGDVRDHVYINGAEEENSGGHILYVSPGIRIGLGHQWTIFSSIGIPVVNDLNGYQSEPDYRVIGGLSANF